MLLSPYLIITFSKHEKCKGNGDCQCENTFLQTNDGKDCACPDGSFLNASANCCYAPTDSPSLSPTSLPVTSAPTSFVTFISKLKIAKMIQTTIVFFECYNRNKMVMIN